MLSFDDRNSHLQLALTESRRLARELAELEARGADPVLLASTRACLYTVRRALRR